MKAPSVVAVAGTVAFALLPLMVPPYYLGLMIPFFGYAIALLGFNLLFGYTGLLSFGHAMFLGIGAYGAAVMTGLGVKSFELVLIAVMSGIGRGCAADWVAMRALRRDLFGMLTLAFGMLFPFVPVQVLLRHWRRQRHARSADEDSGLEFVKYNKIEFLAGPFYYYCLGLLVIGGFVMWRLVHSPFGLHLQTIRDNALKAEYLGVHVRRFRLAAFVISAAFGAVGGAILGFRVGLADPDLVYWTQSGQLVFMAVLGGFANFFGPIVGALSYILLQDQLQSLTQYWRFVLGAILALIVIAFPQGIAGLAVQFKRLVAGRAA